MSRRLANKNVRSRVIRALMRAGLEADDARCHARRGRHATTEGALLAHSMIGQYAPWPPPEDQAWLSYRAWTEDIDEPVPVDRGSAPIRESFAQHARRGEHGTHRG